MEARTPGGAARRTVDAVCASAPAATWQWLRPLVRPTEAGVNARILLLFENPARRADAGFGSGFISADNDDRSTETIWGIFREAGAPTVRGDL
jgi:hypothetical protein